MLSDTMLDGLNKQINMEMQAYYTYLSMSAYFEDRALKGFAAWMFHHAEEEMMHAMKIYNFFILVVVASSSMRLRNRPKIGKRHSKHWKMPSRMSKKSPSPFINW
jgi:bacterioferritin (cytochrome b1)